MKRLFITVVGCILTALPAVKAQDCSNWTNWALRGTYTMSGSGFSDTMGLPGLPTGTAPMFWVGAFTFDGAGSGTGWVSMNVSGTRLRIQLVDMKYSMQPDCSVQWTSSLKFLDLGVISPTYNRLAVVVPKPGGELELHMVFRGYPVGTTPATAYDIGVAHRISMQY